MSDPKFPKTGRPGGKSSARASAPVPRAPALAVTVPIEPPAAYVPATPEFEPASPEIQPEAVPFVAAAAPEAITPPEPTPAPAEADAETNAAPVTVAAAEPAPADIAPPEVVVPTQPDAVAAYSPAPVINKGFYNMATQFDAVTTPAVAAEKVQAMFGGMNDRAKTAIEKSAKIGEEMAELTKGNVEAIVASGKVAAKGAEAMTQEAVEFSKKNFETVTAMFKSFAAVKSPTELFQLQSDYAKSSFDSAVAEASKLSEAWVKLAGEVVQPISSRYAVAAEKLKAAAL
jgi:phasin family protein